MNSPTDVKSLVDLAREGDHHAFECLLRRFDGELRILSHRLLGPRWTEDVLQDAYLRAFEALPRFRSGEGSVAGWFYRIVYRRCLDEFRRAGRETWHEPLPVESVADPRLSEAQMVDRLTLWQALGSLNAEDRACVVLVDALGLDYSAAGDVLGVPRGTVASRLNRARRVVRWALDGNEEDKNGRLQGRAYG
jgi:RNA polymerase sigma-70 factor (ECF subfamily)